MLLSEGIVGNMLKSLVEIQMVQKHDVYDIHMMCKDAHTSSTMRPFGACKNVPLKAH